MYTSTTPDPIGLGDALAYAGLDERVRMELFELLRRAEADAPEPDRFRDHVRWPLVAAALRDVGQHRITLADGLIFDIGTDSRIEKALLLSDRAHPDHVWEPQTTKLLTRLASRSEHAVVGGAYIGDHVLPMARRLRTTGRVHAFEPMEHPYRRLLHNIAINDIRNVVANRMGLWDEGDVSLEITGALALATSAPYLDGNGPAAGADVVPSVTISEYLAGQHVSRLDLIMLDTEGGEERALRGALGFLSQPPGQAPNIVFEVHRDYVDWTSGLAGTSLVSLLREHGYLVFAVRDIHGNRAMDGQPIEVVPVDDCYTDGPPHGFNMLAMKQSALISELDLCVVPGVSPKLIVDKDPALHHPTGGF